MLVFVVGHRFASLLLSLRFGLSERTTDPPCRKLGKLERPGFHLEGVMSARDTLVDRGFDATQWEALAAGLRPPPPFDEDFSIPQHGWQYVATQSVNSQFLAGGLPNQSRALLRSQSGPMASVPHTSCPRRSASFSSVASGSPFLHPAVFAGVAVYLSGRQCVLVRRCGLLHCATVDPRWGSG